MMKHWVAMLAVMSVGVGGAGVAAWPRVAGAQAASATPELLFDQGRRLFETFQYDQAVPIFDRIVSALTSSTPLQKPELLAQTLALRARAKFALADTPGAEQDFGALLVASPSFKLGPGISPRLVAVFESVRKVTVGQVTISLNPAGQATLDGRTITLPADPTLMDMTAGEHQIDIARQGYAPVSQRFVVVAGASAPLALTLERVSATLTLTTVPEGIDVWLDGRSRGTTARGNVLGGESSAFVIADLQPGAHQLQLKRSCYKDLERTIQIARPEDLGTGPLAMTRAVATVKVQTTEPQATVFLDGVSQGSAPFETTALCEGPHSIEVRGPRGRFVDRRDWKTGDSAILIAEMRKAFPIVSVNGSSGAVATELRANVERALASAKQVLVYSPADSDMQAALSGESIPANWLGGDPAPATTATTGPRIPRDVIRDLGRRLSTKLGSQGVASVTVGADPYLVTVALLAAGSGDPDIIAINLGDQVSRTRAIDRLSAPLPPLTRPSIETSVVDLSGQSGAVIVRPGGSGAKAGLAMGEVIVGAGGQSIKSVEELRARIGALHPPSLELPLDVRGAAGATRMVSGAIAMVPDTLPLRDPQLPYNRLLPQVEDAARVATSALDKAATQINLAIVQMRLGNWAEAQTALATVQLPEGAGVSAGTVAYLTGLCLDAQGRTAEARTAFTKASTSLQARLSYDGPLVAPLAQQKLRR